MKIKPWHFNKRRLKALEKLMSSKYVLTNNFWHKTCNFVIEKSLISYAKHYLLLLQSNDFRNHGRKPPIHFGTKLSKLLSLWKRNDLSTRQSKAKQHLLLDCLLFFTHNTPTLKTTDYFVTKVTKPQITQKTYIQEQH